MLVPDSLNPENLNEVTNVGLIHKKFLATESKTAENETFSSVVSNNFSNIKTTVAQTLILLNKVPQVGKSPRVLSALVAK